VESAPPVLRMRLPTLALEVLVNAFAALHRPMPGKPFEASRREAVRRFMARDLDVMVNRRDCCDALGLDVRRVQHCALPVMCRAPAC
jgi:hypothetical protein